MEAAADAAFFAPHLHAGAAAAAAAVTRHEQKLTHARSEQRHGGIRRRVRDPRGAFFRFEDDARRIVSRDDGDEIIGMAAIVVEMLANERRQQLGAERLRIEAENGESEQPDVRRRRRESSPIGAGDADAHHRDDNRLLVAERCRRHHPVERSDRRRRRAVLARRAHRDGVADLRTPSPGCRA